MTFSIILTAYVVFVIVACSRLGPVWMRHGDRQLSLPPTPTTLGHLPSATASTKPRVRITQTGWIRHSGGLFPFDPLTVVETVHASGLSFRGREAEYAAYWPDAWWTQQAASWRNNIKFYRIVDDIRSMAPRLPPVPRR